MSDVNFCSDALSKSAASEVPGDTPSPQAVALNEQISFLQNLQRSLVESLKETRTLLDEQKRQFENTVLRAEKLQRPGKCSPPARVTEICDVSDTGGQQNVTSYRQTDIRLIGHQTPSRETSGSRQSNFTNFNEQFAIVKRSTGNFVQRYVPISGNPAGLLWELLMALVAFDPRILLAVHAFCYVILPRIPAVPIVNLSFNDSFYFIDPFDCRRTLQYSSHRHFEVFISFLRANMGIWRVYATY